MRVLSLRCLTLVVSVVIDRLTREASSRTEPLLEHIMAGIFFKPCHIATVCYLKTY